MKTVLAKEYQVNSCINHRIVIYLFHFEVSWYILCQNVCSNDSEFEEAAVAACRLYL